MKTKRFKRKRERQVENKTSLDRVQGDSLGNHRGLAKLIRELHNEGWTIEEICDEIGCTISEAKIAIQRKNRL